MAADLLDYPALVEGALRGVVREVLLRVADEGIPGDHHFFLTFATGRPGVELPGFLLERYPDEMTIVLQHQFWDLAVDEEAFAVTLSFRRERHRLRVPFAALTGFADPAADFGLRFGERDEAVEEGEEVPSGAEAEGETAPTGDPAKVVSIDRFRKKS
ncbi:MAG: ClpXP protease specificity-enhancing factor SspB [Thermoanaerobaculia bacterium]|nr:ClpXP protease specificity-enhancing factor SspB [Thermoanaerobaculia bacterium]